VGTVNKQKTVTVGESIITVVPQKHARLRRQLSAEDFAKIMSQDYSGESYRVLSILIPTLPDTIPLWKWEGYGSQEAMDNDVYDEAEDQSPTTAEIVDLFEAAFLVSGADRLGKIVDLAQMGVDAGMTNRPQTATPSSAPSLGESGESA
jgi:hypothetical protein